MRETSFVNTEADLHVAGRPTLAHHLMQVAELLLEIIEL